MNAISIDNLVVPALNAADHKIDNQFSYEIQILTSDELENQLTETVGNIQEHVMNQIDLVKFREKRR
jgi:hypothetical protein